MAQKERYIPNNIRSSYCSN